MKAVSASASWRLNFLSPASLSPFHRPPFSLLSSSSRAAYPAILRFNRSTQSKWFDFRSSSTMAASFKLEQARAPSALPLPSPPITKFKIALCQLSVTADKNRNIIHARKAIEEAAQKGGKLVLLPEIWNSPDSNDSFLCMLKILMPVAVLHHQLLCYLKFPKP